MRRAAERCPPSYFNGMRYSSLLLVLLISSCSVSQERSKSEMLSAAVNYLWLQQHDDGGWRSPTHGIAAGGESWTPFVLYHLLQVPDSIYTMDPVDLSNALDYIRRHTSSDGIAGHGDPLVADYPNYATSYALRCLLAAENPADSTLVGLMATYLVSQQMSEDRGFDPNHIAYGAWGFGEMNLRAGNPGHVDLSHTRRVAEALADYGFERLPDPVIERLHLFLATVQRQPYRFPSQRLPYDGGFFASPVVDGVNKGGRVDATDSTDAYYRSYATTTSDGILTLHATGVVATDHRLIDAANWLTTNPGFDEPSGIPPGGTVSWGDVMFFYNLSSRSEAYRALQLSGVWQDEVIEILRARQFPDGHFENPYGSPNKEDDPLIATTLAVNAMLATLE